MNLLIKLGLSFLFGGVVGAGVGVTIYKNKTEKRLNEQLQLLYEKYKSNVDDTEDEPEVDPSEFLEVTEEPKDYKSEHTMPEQSLVRDSREVLSQRTGETHDYTQHFKGGNAVNDDNYDENYALGQQATEEALNAKPPYVVDEITFDEDTRLSEFHANFYIGNQTLTIGDEHTEEEVFDFDDVRHMLGDVLQETGFADDDNDVLYVFNERMGTKYRIDKMFSAYVDG